MSNIHKIHCYGEYAGTHYDGEVVQDLEELAIDAGAAGEVDVCIMSSTNNKTHRYETIGHTIEDARRRRDCTSVYQTVQYSAKTKRIRVEHMTRWQGSRYLTWFFDGQTREDATALLDQIKDQGVECLGDPDRKSAPIR